VEQLRWPFEKLVDWQKCAAVMLLCLPPSHVCMYYVCMHACICVCMCVCVLSYTKAGMSHSKTDWLTACMQQSFWEANSHSAGREISRLLWNPKVHHSAHNSPNNPRPYVMFRNALIFHGVELLAPRLTTKLEDHPLLVVRDCLFNKFTATFYIWRPPPPSAMLWWQGASSFHRTFYTSKSRVPRVMCHY
jgi:hypothetical protein